jgi:hypothetical protein
MLAKRYNTHHPHMLRQTVGRELVANGIDIATVAELMGHADIIVTRRYAKPTERELEEAVSKVLGNSPPPAEPLESNRVHGGIARNTAKIVNDRIPNNFTEALNINYLMFV